MNGRRIASISILLIVVIALCAYLLWAFWVPNYRPSLRGGESYGLDVSRHQGNVDWQKVHDDDIEFVYLKATEGGDYVDKMYQSNTTEATQAGLKVGAYHFFTFCRSGADQAANFLRVAPPRDDALSPALDIEYKGNCKKRPSRDDLLREVQSFVSIVEKAWHRPLITYVLYDTEHDYKIEQAFDRRRWQRKLFRRPTNTKWQVWQVSFRAKVEGISGAVDLNVASSSQPT
jgi:lysozyme